MKKFPEFDGKDREKWLKKAFLDFDLQTEHFKDQGCTVNSAFIDHEKKTIHIANAGDARCILGRNGKISQISKDHVPTDQVEFERIFKAGKMVFGGRIMGNINLSRAFGDHRYKDSEGLPQEQQAVSAEPDVFEEKLEGVDFLLLGCDGIYEKFSNEGIGHFIYENIHKPPK